MELKEAKRLIAYAQRRGIKTLKIGDLEVTFQDAIVFPGRRPAPREASAPVPADKQTKPAPVPEPTLEDINRYIYEQTDEAH